jgi:hypothetical protein
MTVNLPSTARVARSLLPPRAPAASERGPSVGVATGCDLGQGKHPRLPPQRARTKQGGHRGRLHRDEDRHHRPQEGHLQLHVRRAPEDARQLQGHLATRRGGGGGAPPPPPVLCCYLPPGGGGGGPPPPPHAPPPKARMRVQAARCAIRSGGPGVVNRQRLAVLPRQHSSWLGRSPSRTEDLSRPVRRSRGRTWANA